MIKKRLIKLLSHAKKYIAFQIFWQWVALICQIVIIYCIAHLIEPLLYKEFDRLKAINYFGIIATAVLLRFIGDKMAVRASFQASVDVKRILRSRIYEKLMKLGTAYRNYISTSEAVQMSAEGVEQLEIYFGRYLPQLFYAIIAPITLFAVISFINIYAAIVLLICVPLIPISIVLVQKIAKRLLSKYWGVYTGLGDTFLESLQGLTTLKIYQTDEKRAEIMDAESENFRKITMKVLLMQLNSTSVMDFIAYGGAVAGMIVVLLQFAEGNMGIAGSIMIILLASEFFIPMRILGSFFHIAMNGMAAADKIFKLLDMPSPLPNMKNIGKDTSISIEEVSFSYYNADTFGEKRRILNNINMLIPPGSLVSLVGESGCGKSTVAGLITGKNKNYTGSIKIGENELSEISESSLMKNITGVKHNSHIFKGTVRECLLMGNPKAGEKEMLEALEEVNLKGFIESQNGLDTKVLEGGSDFSGGQRQRLAIARALMHDSPIYIFDEATSNIDAESEGLIMDVIHRLSESGKTVIMISHRLSNVKDSDQIYMMSEGCIIENGTHDELMRKNGAYSYLFNRQKELENYATDERRSIDAKEAV